MWVQIALFVASLIISYALQPKQTQAKPATADDFDFPTTDDGTPKCVVFGDVWITGWCVIGVGNYRNTTIYKKQKSLFGSKRTAAGYRYYMSIHMGVCLGMDDLVEIKVSDSTAWTGTISSNNKTSIYINKPDLFGGDDSEGGIQGNLIIMRGASDQAALIELAEMYGTVTTPGYYQSVGSGGYYGTENQVWVPPVIAPAAVPAYRGCVTFFYDGLICANSPYPKEWSFRVRRTITGWDGSVWYPEKATIWLSDNTIKSMNPAHIIYEAQTNSVWGRGNSASQIDTASFKAVADQLYSESFGMCIAWRRQDNVGNFIQEVLDHIGAALFVDRTTGLWKLVLIRDNYDVSTLPSFSYSTGLLRIEEDNNASSDLVTNQTIVTFTDPVSNETQTTRAENLAAIQKFGIIMETKTYTGLPTADLAGRVAARDMKIAQSGLKKFKVVLDRRAYALQPASVFKLNLPDRGIDSIIVRAVRVDHDTVTNGEITITVLQDVFGLPSTNYISEQPSLWQPPSHLAQPVTNQYLYELPYAELHQDFSETELNEISGRGYVAIAAEQPTLLHLGFNILAKLSTETGFNELGFGEFAFVAGITNAVAQTATAIEVQLSQSIDSNIKVGDRAFLGDEIVYISFVDRTANTLTLVRGCIDTVPVSHPVGTSLWIYSNVASAVERAFDVGRIVNLKLITRTAQDQLDEVAAPVINFTVQNRKQRPYPPCNVKINNSYFPEQISGDLILSWSHRNRLQQTDLNALGWTDASTNAEANTAYHLGIYDADNIQLLSDTVEAPETTYRWNVPKRFDGEMTTLFELGISGSENSIDFTDLSPNNFTVNNPGGVRVQTDEASNGKVARFTWGGVIAMPAEKLLAIVQEDHCIEYRIKTLKNALPEPEDAPVFAIRCGSDSSTATSLIRSYITIRTAPTSDSIHVYVNGVQYGSGWIGGEKTISYEATGLSSDEYADVAIQVSLIERRFSMATNGFINNSLVTIYINGIAVASDTLDFIFLENRIENNKDLSLILRELGGRYYTGSAVTINGFRITQRTGGRYTGDYVPESFKIGTDDPYWEDVVLLLPMTGTDLAQDFVDISNSPTAVIASPTFHEFEVPSFFGGAFTVTDAKAHGGSALMIASQTLYLNPSSTFNLADTSFVVEGRAKGFGQILQVQGVTPMTHQDSYTRWKLQISYQLLTITGSTLTPQPDGPPVVSLYHNYVGGSGKNTDDTYFNFKVFFDAGAGTVTLWFNELYTVGNFTFASDPNPVLIIGDPWNQLSVSSLKIQSAEAGSGLIPDVNNPLRIEIESKRDGLPSWQRYQSVISIIE